MGVSEVIFRCLEMIQGKLIKVVIPSQAYPQRQSSKTLLFAQKLVLDQIQES